MPRKGTGNDLRTNINIRVGSKYREKYDKYLLEKNISGASFTRAALDYWMQVDGCPDGVKTALDNAELKIQHLQELISEKEDTILGHERIISEKERIISEKERTISVMQDQIDLLIKLLNNPTISQHISSSGSLNKNVISIKSNDNKDS